MAAARDFVSFLILLALSAPASGARIKKAQAAVSETRRCPRQDDLKISECKGFVLKLCKAECTGLCNQMTEFLCKTEATLKTLCPSDCATHLATGTPTGTARNCSEVTVETCQADRTLARDCWQECREKEAAANENKYISAKPGTKTKTDCGGVTVQACEADRTLARKCWQECRDAEAAANENKYISAKPGTTMEKDCSGLDAEACADPTTKAKCWDECSDLGT